MQKGMRDMDIDYRIGSVDGYTKNIDEISHRGQIRMMRNKLFENYVK